MNNYYQSKNQQQLKKGLPQMIIGGTCSIPGLICTIIGIVQYNSMEAQLSSYFNRDSVNPGIPLIIIGVILLAVGIIMLIIGINLYSKTNDNYSAQSDKSNFDFEDSVARVNELKIKGYITDEEYNAKLDMLTQMNNASSISEKQDSNNKYCSKCGSKISNNSIYCNHCGNKIED